MTLSYEILLLHSFLGGSGSPAGLAVRWQPRRRGSVDFGGVLLVPVRQGNACIQTVRRWPRSGPYGPHLGLGGPACSGQSCSLAMVAVARHEQKGNGGMAFMLQRGGGEFTGLGGARPAQFGAGVSMLPRPAGNRLRRWRTVLLQVVVLMSPSGSAPATSTASQVT